MNKIDEVIAPMQQFHSQKFINNLKERVEEVLVYLNGGENDDAVQQAVASVLWQITDSPYNYE